MTTPRWGSCGSGLNEHEPDAQVGLPAEAALGVESDPAVLCEVVQQARDELSRFRVTSGEPG
jgi:hypothetical protein